ncbi:sugar transferase [Terribacillus saccharophilus]|uniref:sugar transferase n=1 Tax=Terribacillus saccharophilus TaxID=361277 RepID=UPI003982A5D9
MYKFFLKRLFDVLFATMAIIVLLPVIILVSIIIKINLGSPILFKQDRPGRDEEIFKMYKFRTMSDKRNSNGELLPDSDRLTKLGKFLRSTSIDELPELINILKGEMSLIGPRPLAVIYLPYYNEREKVRHSVRPGLTGLAQVNGRNALNWDDRFELDISYVNNISVFNDIKILYLTFVKVFKREGVAVRGTTEIMDFHVYRQMEVKKKGGTL